MDRGTPAPVEDRMMRPKATTRIRCHTCAGVGEVFEVGADGVEEIKPCRRCNGAGCYAILLFLILFFGSPIIDRTLQAATVTGYIRNRQGAYVRTNIQFLAIQRPLFETTPAVLPGWTVTTNSATNGYFSTALLAGDYRVTIGNLLPDSFIIAVPDSTNSYDILQLVTNLVTYTFTGVNFSNAVTSINGSQVPIQLLVTGEDGSEFNIASGGAQHQFNLPLASATKTGKLSSNDWSAFNSKPTQAELNAASNLIYSAILLRALTTDLVASSNVLQTAINLRALTTDLVSASNVLQAAIALRVLQSDFLTASNFLYIRDALTNRNASAGRAWTNLNSFVQAGEQTNFLNVRVTGSVYTDSLQARSGAGQMVGIQSSGGTHGYWLNLGEDVIYDAIRFFFELGDPDIYFSSTNAVFGMNVTAAGNVTASGTNVAPYARYTSDVAFRGFNAASNYVWTCTNATTGQGEWRLAQGGSSTNGLLTDPGGDALLPDP